MKVNKSPIQLLIDLYVKDKSTEEWHFDGSDSSEQEVTKQILEEFFGWLTYKSVEPFSKEEEDLLASDERFIDMQHTNVELEGKVFDLTRRLRDKKTQCNTLDYMNRQMVTKMKEIIEQGKINHKIELDDILAEFEGAADKLQKTYGRVDDEIKNE